MRLLILSFLFLSSILAGTQGTNCQEIQQTLFGSKLKGLHATNLTLLNNNREPKAFPSGDVSIVDVHSYGAVSDASSVLDGQMVSDSNVIFSPSGKFKTNDAGKTISVQGAGPGGSQLTTRVARFIDSHHLELTVAAKSKTVSGAIDTNGISLTNTGNSG
jgi:hypothetical protein